MKKIDLHCDALLKLWENKERHFTNDPIIETNFERLKLGNVKLQFFAIFIEDFYPSDMKFHYALEQIDLFHTKIIREHKQMKKITKWKDIHSLQSGEIGAVLTL